VVSGFVRDVAHLRVRAMENPAAKGERPIATAGESIWLVALAKILKENLGAAADKVKARELPNTALRIAALNDPMVKLMIPLLGRVMNVTGAKAIKLLGWSPRSTKKRLLPQPKA
jgi:dihydroflavonol-4-reductase